MSAVRREAHDVAFTLNPAATTLTIIDALNGELGDLGALCDALFNSEGQEPRCEFWALSRRISVARELVAELGHRAMRGVRDE